MNTKSSLTVFDLEDSAKPLIEVLVDAALLACDDNAFPGTIGFRHMADHMMDFEQYEEYELEEGLPFSSFSDFQINQESDFLEMPEFVYLFSTCQIDEGWQTATVTVYLASDEAKKYTFTCRRDGEGCMVATPVRPASPANETI